MVIVVGAGPAGAVAARTLARAGVPVTLLERAAGFPRNKPCGGGISIRVLSRFPWLEPTLASIATLRLSRLYLEGPDGDSTVIASDNAAVLMIRRVEFDAVLVREATDAGATLVTGVEIVRAKATPDLVVLEARDGRRFEAPVVIAADGVHSIVARRLGLNPGWPPGSVAVDMMEETPRDTLDADRSTLWVSYGYAARANSRTHDTTRAPEGYAYIFPKRDHVNVGIGYVLDHFRADVDAHPYALQQEFVAHLRDRGLVTGGSVRKNFTPFIIPVGGPLKRPGDGRVLLAGDAGGFVNGFTAEGIYYAMVTGEHAARAVIATAPRDIPSRLASRYHKAWRREVGAELRDSVLVRRYLFADRRRIARVIAAARHDPAITRSVLDYAMGRASYAGVRRRVIAGAPVVAARLLIDHVRTRLLQPGNSRATISTPPGQV
ncbi:MAG: NAD(P)/FAD-dependent oxidoreductase [Acidobacteria bacterium]|nr:NAD(P)/FAD-dependent oxidoreductase [Acidobacteriota bacterium]